MSMACPLCLPVIVRGPSIGIGACKSGGAMIKFRTKRVIQCTGLFLSNGHCMSWRVTSFLAPHPLYNPSYPHIPIPSIMTPLRTAGFMARKHTKLKCHAHTRPSYNERADTIVSSRSLPSLNSAMSSEPFSSLSIILNILRTRFSGVSSSTGSLTIEPTWK